MSRIPISILSLVNELGGQGITPYLRRFGDASCVEAMLRQIVTEEQSELEIDLGIRFFQTRFLSTPLLSIPTREDDDLGLSSEPDDPTQPALPRDSLGTPTSNFRPWLEYDETEDAYDYSQGQLNNFGNFRVRCRPLVSIQRMALRYGNENQQNTIAVYPSQWLVPNRRMGLVSIVPLIGMSGGQSFGAFLAPVIGSMLANGSVIPQLIAIDYTAGFLPPDYNPDAPDNPDGLTPYQRRPSEARLASPDQDCLALLKALRFKACAGVLKRLNRAIAPGGGSLSLGSASQSFAPNRFSADISTYEADAANIINLYRRTYNPPAMFAA